MDILFKNDHFVFSYRVGGILSGNKPEKSENPVIMQVRRISKPSLIRF